MKPKLVILFGGPRPGKNTDLALEIFLSGMSGDQFEMTRFDLRKMKIHPCTGCYHCAASGICVFRDDMDLILKTVDEADGVILATPFYFNSVSALSKIMIDRFQVKWTNKFMLKAHTGEKPKRGLLLVTAGAIQKKNEREGARLVADLFFQSIRATFEDFLFIEGTDTQPVSAQTERHPALREAGERFSSAILADLK